MADLGNNSVFAQADASNASGTMPSWSGAAAPSTLDDAGRALQGAVTREWNWRNFTLTAGGTADAKTLTYSTAPAAYYNGQRFAFIANTTNTTTATLNVNGLGAKTIKSMLTGTLTNLAASDMVAGEYVEVSYNLANDCFAWVNQGAPQGLGTGDSPQFAGINVGNASDTTITRSAAGVIAVEGGVVPKENRANTFSADQVINASLGIGASPSYPLDVRATTGQANVQSSTGTNHVRYLAQNTGGSFQFAIDGSAGSTFGVTAYGRAIFSDGAYPVSIFTNGSERIRFDSGGNVGIGSASAGAKLAVSNAGAATMEFFITYPGGGTGTYIQSYNRSGAAYVDTAYDALTHSFRTSGTERIRITSAGGVSFGSSGTAYGTTGQVLISQGNAPPVWGNAGAVLLGTLTTTSGASQTLSSLVLTNYKFLRLVFNGVSGIGSGTFSFGSFLIAGSPAAGDAWIGIIDVDLATGIGASNIAATAGASTTRVGSTGYTTASTSVTLSISTGTFDAGSVAVYGVA